MSANITNQVSFLRTSRSFPQDPQALSVELDRAYLDIAQSVNSRIIGLFPANRSSTTGESWFVRPPGNQQNNSPRQQTSRQVYLVTGTGNIAHGLNLSQIPGFTRIYGTFTNGTNWYSLPYVDSADANNQISLVITPTNIVITAGSGTPPAIISGFVVLEFLANF